MVQLISDTIYCLQESHPQRHPVDPEKSNRALGFPALVTGLCSPTGCSFPPARSRHHDIGKYAHRSTDFWFHLLFAGIAPARHPVDPKKSNGVLELSSSNYGPLSVLRSARRPQQGHQAPINRAFIEKYCAPRQAQGETPQQPGDGRQRATDASSPPPKPHSSSTKRLERCLRHMADQ